MNCSQSTIRRGDDFQNNFIGFDIYQNLVTSGGFTD